MKKVIIAEDNPLIADMLAEVLANSGYEVIGTARTVDRAIELIERHKPDLAILDIRLAEGGLGSDIGRLLKHQSHVGVLYATGYGGGAGLTKADGDALLEKPYRPEDVVRSLRLVEQIVRSGKATRPFPKGFLLLNEPPRARLSNDRLIGQIGSFLKKQRGLAGFGTYALGESDLGNVFTEATRICVAHLDASYCMVYRYRQEANDLLVVAGAGLQPGIVGRVVAQADVGSPQGRAYVTGEPVFFRDLRSDTTLLLPTFHTEHHVISILGSIIGNVGQPYGVLEIGFLVYRDFGLYDVDLVVSIANVLAEAIGSSERRAAIRRADDQIRDLIDDRDRSFALHDSVLKAKDRLLDDRSVLTRELQHRVRNNLLLVHAMLDKEIHATTNPPAMSGFSAIAHRVMVLVEIYEHLLGTGLMGTMDLGGYIVSLCSRLRELYGSENPKVVLTCQPVWISLRLDTVTTLGLAVAELVVNGYAHAFPDGTGSICVSLSQSGAGATITVADDGVGFADAGESNRHGLGLVKRLMEQVGGTATFLSESGSEWTLRFPASIIPPVDMSPSD